jgi:hypothetical protein
VVRDSKARQDGTLIFSRTAWAGFITSVKDYPRGG